jgi:hypothetical protein
MRRSSRHRVSREVDAQGLAQGTQESAPDVTVPIAALPDELRPEFTKLGPSLPRLDSKSCCSASALYAGGGRGSW